jgi:hypothetical protein
MLGLLNAFSTEELHHHEIENVLNYTEGDMNKDTHTSK